MRTIAGLLGRSPSTISREIKRDGGYAHYRAVQAEQAAWKKLNDQNAVNLLVTKSGKA